MLIALEYVVTVPVWEATDEAGHFDYVRFIRVNHALPYQPPDPRQLVLSHWFHPPLYYALGALLTGWIDVSDFSSLARPNPHFQWVQGDGPGGWNVFMPVRVSPPLLQGTLLAVYLLRIVSVAIGAGTVLIAHRLASLLVPGRSAIALGTAALTAFSPSFIYMASGAHNDTLAALLGSAVILWSVSTVVKPRACTIHLLKGGALLGLALLTKTSALALVPVLAAAAAVAALRLARSAESDRRSLAERLPPDSLACRAAAASVRSGGQARLLATTALPLLVALAIAGWWYVRNLVLYGDPLAWQRYTATHAFLVRSTPYDLAELSLFLNQLARTYWAAFGYMNLVIDERLYLIIWAGCLASILGLLRALWCRSRHHDSVWLAAGWTIALASLATYSISLVRYSSILGGVGHGRLIYPVVGVSSLLLASGIYHLPPRPLAAPLVAAAALGLAALSAASPVVYIQPAYAIPQPVPAGSLADVFPSGMTFGGHLRLIGWRLSPKMVRPGERAVLRLYWQATASGGPDLLVNTRLLDREGTTLFQRERRPLYGHLPTDLWTAGDVYEDVYDVEVPSNAYSGRSPIEVSVRPPHGDYWSSVDRTGRNAGVAPVVAHVAIGSPLGEWRTGSTGSEFRRQSTLDLALGDRVRLVGYDLAKTAVKQGGELSLALYWKAEGSIDANYSVFVHVADESGRPVAQQDGEPRRGAYPTSVWRPGEVILDPYIVTIPGATPPGQYRLVVGMYLLADGHRLPVETGSRGVGADFVELTSVTVIGE